MFSTEEKSRQWLEGMRWTDGVTCPRCGSSNVVRTTHPNQTHRCKDCRKNGGKAQFSVKTNTVMEGSHLKCRVWAIGIYLYTTNIKGISSLRLHRELGIGQKAAWFMLHRLRKAAELGGISFGGPVEVDESYFGGKKANMSNTKRKALKDTGQGAVNKAAVVGIKDRETNEVRATVVENTDKETLQGFIVESTDKGASGIH